MNDSRYRLSKSAIDDLESIWFYTFENWSKDQADEYLNLIYSKINILSKNPELGKPIDHIRLNYKSLIAGSHIIFYNREDKHLVNIVRILHYRRDIEEFF